MSAMLNAAAEGVRPSVVEIRTFQALPPTPGTVADRRGHAGSGIVIRPDGWILTSAHVVAGAIRIQVTLADGRSLEGQLAARDDRSDLALVQVPATGLVPARPGDSSALRLGELVLALGHPFGRELTVSLGVVGRGPARGDGAPAIDFIQTDAAVHPGSSGGPVINMAGEVVGVTTLATRSGSMGFAVPVDTVRALLPELVHRGRVAWGWLGITAAESEPGAAGAELAGVLLGAVVAGSPADQAGLRPGDRVLAVDGRAVDGAHVLPGRLAGLRAGTALSLQVQRGRARLSVQLVAGPYPEGLAPRPAGTAPTLY
jgi:S1-C subfamily serine protease